MRAKVSRMVVLKPSSKFFMALVKEFVGDIF